MRKVDKKEEAMVLERSKDENMEELRRALRIEAEKNLTNINQSERSLRKKYGAILLMISLPIEAYLIHNG